MNSFTLEDVNTILLKYGELDAPEYSMPHINVLSDLYRGNSNKVEDVLSLPSDVEFTVYFENRPVDEIILPRDYKDSCTLRVVTRSHYPFVDSDVEITIPVVTKHLTSLEDLNGFDYGYVDELSNVTGVISNDIYILLSDDAVVTGCNLTFDADVTLNGDLTVSDSFITNNSILSFDNVLFNTDESGMDYLIVNNGTLSIMNSSISSTLPFILDKGVLELVNSSINCLNSSVPFIYSNNTGYNIKGNTVSYSDTVEYMEFGTCFIRTTTADNINRLITDNTFQYDNVKVTIDEVDYVLNGNGVCYSLIDDDTVYMKDLEVN